MTWAEFHVFVDGYRLSQGGKEEVTDDEYADALLEEQIKGRA